MAHEDDKSKKEKEEHSSHHPHKTKAHHSEHVVEHHAHHNSHHNHKLASHETIPAADLKHIAAQIEPHRQALQNITPSTAQTHAVDSFKKPEKNWGIFEFLRPHDEAEKKSQGDNYGGTSIAKGTYNHPSPVELAIMKMEGYHDHPTFDGFHSYDISYGVPVEKGEFGKYKRPITSEEGFNLMQGQISKKIGQMRDAFGPNLDKLPPHKVDALLSFCYNIDVSHKEMGSMIAAVRSGNTENVGEMLKDYCHAKESVRHHNRHGKTYFTLQSVTVPGLVERRGIESDLWNGDIKTAFDKISKWHGLDDEQQRSCLLYYASSDRPTNDLLTAAVKPNDLQQPAKTTDITSSKSGARTNF